MAEFIRYERGLRRALLEDARAILGPRATEAEVQAVADEEYWGPLPVVADREETPEEREEREREHARKTAEVQAWGLPKI